MKGLPSGFKGSHTSLSSSLNSRRLYFHPKYATGQLISVFAGLHIEKSSEDIIGQLISVYMNPYIDKSIVILRANDVPRQLTKRI